MDDLYVSLEDCRRFVIRQFPHNKIVSFPQTMAFSNAPYGQKRLYKTVNIYNQHKRLHIFTREEKSFQTPCIVFDNSNQKISGVYDWWNLKAQFHTLIEACSPIGCEQSKDNGI